MSETKFGNSHNDWSSCKFYPFHLIQHYPYFFLLLDCNKLNILGHFQTPQTPIVRTSSYTKYNIDEFPTGTNAIVAVLAYTG